MSTRTMSVASGIDAHNTDDLRERAELRAELEAAPSNRVTAIEKAVYALAKERGVRLAPPQCHLITDQAFAFAKRWMKGDTIAWAARRIIEVL